MPINNIPYDKLEPLIREKLSTEEHERVLELMSELKIAQKRGYLLKSDLEKICKWKSARAIRLIESNSEKMISKLTSEAFKTRSEEKKIEALTALKGVSIPMASSILMLLNPKRYGVIDIRVWELLYSIGTVKTNPKGKNIKFKEWYRYLVIIRYFADKFKVSARDIERTLFYVHQEYQKGKLYSNEE